MRASGPTTRVVVLLCCLVPGITWAGGGEGSHKRRERQTSSPVYHVDILVLTDHAVFKSYVTGATYALWYDRTNAAHSSLTRRDEALRNIRQYFTLVIKEVSAQYGRLQTTAFRLQFRPVGFYIVDAEGSVTWTQRTVTGQVNTDRALTSLQTWIQTTSGLPAFDHAMLFTGEDLSTDGNGHTAGRATVRTLCSGPSYSSVSVIEDRGAFQSVSTAVHELGHSLGAVHDGTANNCSMSDRYVMSAVSGDATYPNRRHPWFFSSCSSSEIETYVTEALKNADGARCFQTALPVTGVPDVTGVSPGQLYDSDVQCRHLYGQQSAFCFLGNLSDVCTSMTCLDPSDPLGTKCFRHVAATGTCCGNKQWCQVGECVQSDDAPDCRVCLDQAQTVNGLRCVDVARTQPRLCYLPDVDRTCCRSCQQARDANRPGCPYGDKLQGCSPQVCSRILPNGDIPAEDCCGTCNHDNSTWTCADAASVDGELCDVALRRQGVQGCYNYTLAYHCCASCRRLRDASRKGCEYGDRLLRGCPTSTAAITSDSCDTVFCCRSCNSTDSGGIRLSSPSQTTVVAAFVSVFQILIHFLQMH